VVVAATESLVTGIVTLIRPSLFCRLILGADPGASGAALGPLAGIAMLGTGLASWSPAARPNPLPRTIGALMAYNVLATIYLAYLGSGDLFAGVLLWPAVVLHAVLSALLGYAWLGQRG
jgi:hypothetical protein